MSSGPPDPGLQPERTALAWRRTALSVLVVAAGVARVVTPVLGVLALLAAAAGGLQALAVTVLADRRYRAARRGPAGAGPARGAGALVTATATSAAVLGLLSLAFVVVDRAVGG